MMDITLSLEDTANYVINMSPLGNDNLNNEISASNDNNVQFVPFSEDISSQNLTEPIVSMVTTPVTTPPSLEAAPTIETLNSSPGYFCAGCKQKIRERYLLESMDMVWHDDCLKCSCCGCRLGEVGSSLYTKANLLLCKRDYLRLFGATGQCAICNQSIPGFEMVMRIKDSVYHVECFKCQQCRQKFSVGDKLYLCEGRILCEYDFEEQNLITSIQRGYSAFSQLRKQPNSFSNGANGKGSQKH